jgi:hypothetical protein
MVSNRKIKDLDFQTIEDYFQYITDSIINGQRQQARELISELSTKQKKEALMYYELLNFNEESSESKKLILESL